MVTSAEQSRLFDLPAAREDLVVVNGRAQVRTQDGCRVVTARGIVLAHYRIGDRMAEAHAMVSLVEQGWAEQSEVARAFGVTTRTLRRQQRRYEEGGLSALGRSGGYPKGRPRLPISRAAQVRKLKEAGNTTREVARRLGVTEKAIRKQLRAIGWIETPAAGQLKLALADADPNLSGRPEPTPAEAALAPASAADPNLSGSPKPTPAEAAPAPISPADPNLSGRPEPTVAEAAPAPASPADPNLPGAAETSICLDRDPTDRRLDRFLAFLGILDDAVPLFGSAKSVPRAGVLMAIPALLDIGVFEIAREVYGSIGPAFYGLRTTMATLLLSALLRIKRPEGFKEHSPTDLGRLLGLDRAPEVKTVRRKLRALADLGRAADFGRQLARRRASRLGAALGFLYVDGHVRVYHGATALPKTHITRMRIALPATTDYWVNDASGDPLFVLTAPANAGMVQMLPRLLAEMRQTVGKRRLTVVFDRGGFSHKLFADLLKDGFDLLTYRKGKFRRLPRSRFKHRSAVIEGRKVEYELADQNVRLKKGLSLRQVTRLSPNGHQTPVLTSRRDLSDIEVAFRMFERWRQENFFKYLREEYALDALVDYDVEPDDRAREVPNPARKAIDERLREAVSEMNRLKAAFGIDALLSMEDLKSFAQHNRGRGEELLRAFGKVVRLENKRAKTPARVPIGRIREEVLKLDTERKHLTNVMKTVAYQAESDLVRQLAPHYARAEDEGRTLLQSAFNSSADIQVISNELRITLAPLSSPHRSRAITALCRELTARRVTFPGTNLVMCWAVKGLE